MAVLLDRIPLAAVLAIAIVRIACAEAISVPQSERFVAPEIDAPSPQSSRSPQVGQPLRLALALSSERQFKTPKSNESMLDASPLSVQTREVSVLDFVPALRAIDAPSPQSMRSLQDASPLRLTLALHRESLPATPRQEAVQEPEALQLTQRKRSVRPNALANAPKLPSQLTEPSKNDNAPQQKTQDMADGDPILTWEISAADRTLNTTLNRWASSAGWQLVWDLEVDFPIETRAVLQGTFEEAVTTVAQSLASADVPVQATFYEGNRVLRVVAKGSK